MVNIIKHFTIVIYDSRVVIWGCFQVRYDSRVVIYERKIFIRLATGSILLVSSGCRRYLIANPDFVSTGDQT